MRFTGSHHLCDLWSSIHACDSKKQVTHAYSIYLCFCFSEDLLKVLWFSLEHIPSKLSWSTGYGKWLTFVKLWVWIPGPYTGCTWHFVTLFCCINCIVCLKRPKDKLKRGPGWPILWKSCKTESILCFVPTFVKSKIIFHEKWDLKSLALIHLKYFYWMSALWLLFLITLNEPLIFLSCSKKSIITLSLPLLFSTYICRIFFFKWANPGLFNRLFSVFSNKYHY